MRDKQQTTSAVASPTAYVYGRLVLGVKSEVQATTSLFATAHAMPCYVHCSARGRGHPRCRRQGAKEEEEQEQKASAYDDVPASRNDSLERVLLFFGDRKRKEKNKMPMSQCGGGGHSWARANKMELQRPAVTADCYEFDSREQCLFAPQLQLRPFYAIFTPDQLSQQKHDSASACSCRHACQFPAPCLQRTPLLALRPTSLPHYSHLLSA
ncbi:hypothetical protein J3E72DRAFT_296581 [Bipolaris maydis]|uniref:uncharacterized protein n=1 Tax=Cochliobolus heterostrophus TaxID=5016 RepID=UPI0024D94253|nr:hypothetical protein J3E73DRAFT_274999 [Bipolaris maydis]KAJ5065202.1 hypothetical protein J3E74DRAFT_300250 [Bipolaris maydis]KAJ6191874.1 hypothetical protein J3E72DRAFT_367426 [Bipolaris maydis]KAJ6200415.1 hypothetical protein J3E72DRAFT_296581 [Bipolaris maydis]KAJ6213751.1 hypothetical protein PSV09DRAFT_2279295 [Bipolaris maydis]